MAIDAGFGLLKLSYDCKVWSKNLIFKKKVLSSFCSVPFLMLNLVMLC